MFLIGCPENCHLTTFGDSKSVNISIWGWFNIKMPSCQYRKFHCGNKTILWPSYLHKGVSYTAKMASLYWIKSLSVSVPALTWVNVNGMQKNAMARSARARLTKNAFSSVFRCLPFRSTTRVMALPSTANSVVREYRAIMTAWAVVPNAGISWGSGNSQAGPLVMGADVWLDQRRREIAWETFL